MCEINEKCTNCKEKTKHIAGFWDGKDGTHGCIYDCRNFACEEKIRKMEAGKKLEERQKDVQRVNRENGVDVPKLIAWRRENKISMRKMADLVGIGAAEYSSYEHEREPFPKDAWEKCVNSCEKLI